jgi:Domain of unknown function (DUF4385)
VHRIPEVKNKWIHESKVNTLLRYEIRLPDCWITVSQFLQIESRNLRHRPPSSPTRSPNSNLMKLPTQHNRNASSLPISSSVQETQSPKVPSISYSSDLRHPQLYRIGKGEQGVLMVEPYKSEVHISHLEPY